MEEDASRTTGKTKTEDTDMHEDFWLAINSTLLKKKGENLKMIPNINLEKFSLVE